MYSSGFDIVSAFSSVPDNCNESARDVGAGKLRAFFKMNLCLSLKDDRTFLFMSNILSFTTPYLMGRNNPMMLGVYLRRQFQTSMYYELSAALSVVISCSPQSPTWSTCIRT